MHQPKHQLYLAAHILAVAICVLLPSLAQAQWTENVLFNFSNGASGNLPTSGLSADACGNLYGITSDGGENGAGTLFELTPPADGGSGPWAEAVLYNFCSQGGSSCTDGAFPFNGVIFDAIGNLYGVTGSGGDSSCNCGTVFQLSPPASGGGPWVFTTLYAFTGGPDGGFPDGSLTLDAKGNIYGATEAGGNVVENKTFCGGGAAPGCGVVFEVSPPASAGGAWTESVPYAFCSQQAGDICLDGSDSTGVVFDARGNAYGAAEGGGANNAGFVYKLTPSTDGSAPWNLTNLYNFCSQPECADGFGPQASLVLDAYGNLYGTSYNGGIPNSCSSLGCGVAFELSPPSTASGTWAYKVLHSFETSEGGSTEGRLVFDSTGNLYGAGYIGGYIYPRCPTNVVGYCGTIFELSPSSGGTWAESTIYSFTDGLDGAKPEDSDGLIIDAEGNLYGTTIYGGLYGGCSGDAGCGVIFQFAPPSEPGRARVPGRGEVRNPSSGGSACALTDTTAALASSVNPSTSGELVIFTAAISLASGASPFLTGTVAFTQDETAISGCQAVSLTQNVARCATSTLPVGADLIVAAYSGDAAHGPSSAQLSQVVNFAVPAATTTAVSSSLNPSTAGQSVTFTATVSPAGPPTPTGTVAFTANGTTMSGCSAVALGSSVTEQCSTSALPPGTNTIAATYSGDSNYTGSSGDLSQVVNPAAADTTTTVASSLNPSTFGDAVTLTASVSPAGPPAPTGTVAFTSNGTTISGCSAVALRSSATAQCATSALPVGTDAIVATYSGDSNYSSSNGSLSQMVNAAAVAALHLTATPTTLTVVGGQTGNYSLAVSATGTVTAPVIFACTGLPSDSSCTFSPSAVPVGGLPATVAMTVSTTTADARLRSPRSSPLWAVPALMLPGLLLLPGGVRKRKMRRLRKADWLLLGLLVMMAMSWVGCCGTAGGGVVGPAQKSYTISVTASATGATPATATVDITVTQ